MPESHYALVFTSWRGRVSHLINSMHSANDPCFAVCGLQGPWYGTGSMDEIEQAQELPLCARCAARVPPERRP